MLDLREAARDALEALERIGKDFVCRSAHHAKKDQHSAFAECPVVVRHTDAIESLRTALAQQVTLVPQEWTNLLAYALQDDMHNRLTPRVVDIAYTAFTLAKRPNAEDGGASDWFNDTKPKVTELIAKLRKDLIEEFAAAPAPVAQQGEQQVCAGCGIPVGDVHMSTCKSGKWPSRVSNGDTAAPAPQPAQGVPEVGFGNMPYSPYLFGGLRFKMNFDKSGNATNFHGVESSLQGAWVALVDATDNRHLQSAQPVAPPLTLEQILDIVKKLDETPDMSHVDVLKTFARAIEAAHGIREVK